MSIVKSTIYGQGQKFSESTYQGSTYLEATYTNQILFDSNFNVTNPTRQSFYGSTISNYPETSMSFFMGSFEGFWFHKIYNDGFLVMTVQGVDQDLFIPVQHDRVESVALETITNGTIPCPDCPVRPPVPAPATGILLCLAAICTFTRSRAAKT